MFKSQEAKLQHYVGAFPDNGFSGKPQFLMGCLIDRDPDIATIDATDM